MTDLTADYLALRREVGAVEVERDVMWATGPDTISFLDGQLSQEVTSLAVGESRWSWLLQPTGKVDALLRVSRTGAEEVFLDTDAGWGDRVRDRLERFKLRTRCDFEAAAGWRCVALRGPRAHEFEGQPADWAGLAGVDLLGPDVMPPEGVRVCDRQAYEAVRIESGWPLMGRELDDTTIPAEAGQWLIDRTVSFTKGCFTGQELVARIDSRGGHVPRRLMGVVLTTNVLPPQGAVVRTQEGAEAGRLTSVAESLDRRAPVALALVARKVEAEADVVVAWEGGQAPARVETLPLVD